MGRLNVYLKIMFIFAAVRCVMDRCNVRVQYDTEQRKVRGRGIHVK